LGGGSWHEKQIFPEEIFAEVEWERFEERWRKEQSLSGRKGTRLVSQGGRGGDGSVVAMGREIGWVDDGEE
jgi:hypothetical protein